MRLTEFHPGHLFWMPRGATWLNRDKPRPFVLATRCRTGGRGTLIYGSTRNTEARMGAASVQVGPQPAGVNRNGLRERTHFYPGILVRDRCEVLPSHSGSVGRYLEALRIALYRALGIGKGSCLSPGAPAGSRRGRIVRLKGRLAVAMRTPFAVLLTEAWYSREQHYHAILPLVSGAGESVGPHVLRVEARGWMAVFPQPPRSVFLPISVVHSVWYDRDIAHETDQVLDDATLTEIDQRLCAYFSLPYDAPEG
jgi:hypothetical protein